MNPLCKGIKSDLKKGKEGKEANEKEKIQPGGFKKDKNVMIAKFKVNGKQKEINSKVKDETDPFDPMILRDNFIDGNAPTQERVKTYRKK